MENEFNFPEEERNKGNLIVDAKLDRNKKVEDRFNVNMTLTYTGTYDEVSDWVSKTVLSGTDEFDLLMGMLISSGNLVKKNLFLNWYDIEHIDFSKAWWAKSNTDELTYNGVCALAISDFNYSSIASTYCMVFNKDLAAAYEMGDIYSIVLDGKWTFDKLTELVKGIWIDNGNDTADNGDFYGMAHGNGSQVNTYLWAFDNPVCKKDEEGVPKIAIKTDKIDSIVNGIYDLIYNTGGVYYEPHAVSGSSYASDMFFAKKAIFTPAQLAFPTGENARNFDNEYGLLPYPKWDENQQNYHTMADGFHTCLAVPKTCRDTDFVGRIVEALSAESWKTVTPTFYEIALKTRYLRDNESKEVLDIIIDGRVFDFGYVYDGFQGYSFTIQRMMQAKNNNFMSEYNRLYSSARLQYKMVVKAFDKMAS